MLNRLVNSAVAVLVISVALWVLSAFYHSLSGHTPGPLQCTCVCKAEPCADTRGAATSCPPCPAAGGGAVAASPPCPAGPGQEAAAAVGSVDGLHTWGAEACLAAALPELSMPMEGSTRVLEYTSEGSGTTTTCTGRYTMVDLNRFFEPFCMDWVSACVLSSLLTRECAALNGCHCYDTAGQAGAGSRLLECAG